MSSHEISSNRMWWSAGRRHAGGLRHGIRGGPEPHRRASRLTGTIPTDGRCTHITSTRLSDFAVSSYQGPLGGAEFTVNVGEAHVTATAYPEPCSAEPAEPPWIADEQIANFTGGANVLVLSFHSSASVTIDPEFEQPGEIAVRPGTGARLARNGEDVAGPGFALDGWNVTALTLPPAAPTETVLFSVRGQGGSRPRRAGSRGCRPACSSCSSP